MGRKTYLLSLLGLLLISSLCLAEEDKTDEKTETEPPTVDEDVGKSRDGSKTDDEAVQREEEAIKLDGLNVAQMKELREKAEKFAFQAEVSRMMKLIINSLYRNKEIFLRELISNSSDALDKIRFLSLTDKSALAATEELSIKIKADKENNILHVTDTGIGMTKDDLVKNLGTIAKSGTSEFFQKMADAQSSDQASDLIGQFGVGFYSSFLVADRVIVTSKHNDDKQYIWESDAASFSITEDPRGNTLQRGTTVSVHLKEEARDFLEPETIKDLVKKYSQFINFNIYLWTSKTEEVEEPVEEEASTDDKKADESAEDKKEEKDEEKEEEKKDEEKEKEDKDDDVEVEEESEEKEKKPKTKKVEKTTWDWELINTNKPIWSRKPKDVKDEEYNEFYKSFTKDHDDPLAKTHFVAEGEVTFRSILYVPKSAPHNLFSEYGKKMDQIKLYVRRVFITDNFEDMMPKYLSFIRGVVDSDDLPLNVSRETLQQHKLLKVIKKKLVRKALDMIKKIPKEDYMDKFWKEFSTSIKLGVMEDHSNRTRLAKLLRFYSSNSEKEMTSLADYIERMKEKQEAIYFMAGTSRKEVETSPFVEKLLKKGYEVLYLIEPVDEYCIQSLPEFEGKKFQNVAKEGLKIGEDSEKQKKKQAALESTYEPLLKWLKEDALKDLIEKAAVSQRLDESPCALVASSYGWSGNMERIMRSQAYAKSGDPSNEYYANQKKTLEVNPRHPLVKELLKRVETDKEDKTAKDLARVLFETATLRSGYLIKDSQDFAGRIERMLRLSMGVDLEAMVEPEEEEAEEKEEEEDKDGEEVDAEGDKEDEKTEEESATAEEAVTEGETKPDEKEDEVEGESKEAPAEPKDEL
ncbi:endoplasmin-like isoform X2 [Orbicella faveolata]|uniref:endoplasmin-like isoform X1 n=1 Tax=Orbicella faveolata TaxID=48498 RepID=UPI0009E2C860|nr:endoplasmin-like isoform X1 [Orbicella faveolata]XP_020606734.1 endoplasmin-like isoform X2 [Orbicella faveolata]